MLVLLEEEGGEGEVEGMDGCWVRGGVERQEGGGVEGKRVGEGGGQRARGGGGEGGGERRGEKKGVGGRFVLVFFFSSFFFFAFFFFASRGSSYSFFRRVRFFRRSLAWSLRGGFFLGFLDSRLDMG